MLTPHYTKTFEKDLKRMLKRGKAAEKIKSLMRILVEEGALEAKHRDHKLAGTYRDRRDCHVEPDWVLIYKRTESDIVFERTGTHTDLFE